MEVTDRVSQTVQVILNRNFHKHNRQTQERMVSRKPELTRSRKPELMHNRRLPHPSRQLDRMHQKVNKLAVDLTHKNLHRLVVDRMHQKRHRLVLQRMDKRPSKLVAVVTRRKFSSRRVEDTIKNLKHQATEGTRKRSNL